MNYESFVSGELSTKDVHDAAALSVSHMSWPSDRQLRLTTYLANLALQ